MTPRFTPCAGVDWLLGDEALPEPEPELPPLLDLPLLELPPLVLPPELVLPVDAVPPPDAGVTDEEPPPVPPDVWVVPATPLDVGPEVVEPGWYVPDDAWVAGAWPGWLNTQAIAPPIASVATTFTVMNTIATRSRMEPSPFGLADVDRRGGPENTALPDRTIPAPPPCTRRVNPPSGRSSYPGGTDGNGSSREIQVLVPPLDSSSWFSNPKQGSRTTTCPRPLPCSA